MARVLLAVATLCLMALFLEPPSAHAAEPVVGRPHPPLRLPTIELPTIDGKRTIDLRDLRGKKVVLIQFASW